MFSNAMVMREFERPLEMTRIEIPPLEDGQVLVKIDVAGVCGSDVHMYHGEDPRTPLPIILGHEGVGRVVSFKGERKMVRGETVKEGDRIIWNRGWSCGHCEACAIRKEPALCEDRKVYGINISAKTTPYLNGCYSQYIILSAQTDLFKVEDSIPSDVLVTTACSGATVAHGFDMIRSCMGQKVLVQGPGPLGAYAVAFAKSMGASEIIVIGGSQSRLDLCREFGATMTLNRRETTMEERREAVAKITAGKGVDLVVETAGSQGVVEEGIKLVRVGGTYLSIGFSQPAGIEKIDFYSEVVKKNLRLQGVWVSDCRHTSMALEIVRDAPALFQKLISNAYPLEEANQALSMMEKREAMKIVLRP